jgi:protein-tyrosine-phosphatase
VPATETSLPALAFLPEDDPLRCKAVLPSPASMELALDKERTAALARQLGVPVPVSRLIREPGEIGPEAPLPVVLKPVRSKVLFGNRIATLAAALVRDEETRRRLLDRWLPYTPVLQQEYAGGRGIGIELLYDRGRMRWAFAHERLHEMPLTGGASTYRRSIEPPPALLDSAVRLLDALRWHGVAMVEFKGVPEGPYCLMEINPRLWGSLALTIDAGIDFPHGLWLLAGGESPGAQPRYRRGQCTRYVPGDIQWMSANWRADHADPLLLTRPRRQALLEWFRPLTGRESWDHWNWRDLRLNASLYSRMFRAYAESWGRKAARRRLARQARAGYRNFLDRRPPFDKPVRRILFLCLGNICRSPFAGAWARKNLGEFESGSAGLGAISGRTSPEHVIHAAEALGLDLTGRPSEPVERERMEWADLILVMDLENYEAVARRFPEALPRTLLLGPFAPGGGLVIEDPYNSSEEETRRIFEGMLKALEGLAPLVRRK